MAVTGDLALCTLADVGVKLMVDPSSWTPAQVAFIEAAIDEASAVVAVALGRDPMRYEADLVDHPRGYVWPKIRTKKSPVRAIDSIVIAGATRDASAYVLEDKDAAGVSGTGIVAFKDEQPFTGYLAPGTNERDPWADTELQDGIVITYDAGWWLPGQGAKPVLSPVIPDLPRDIRSAVAAAVALAFQRAISGYDPAVQSERLMSHSVTYFADSQVGTTFLPGWPAASVLVLKKYRRITQR